MRSEQARPIEINLNLRLTAVLWCAFILTLLVGARPALADPLEGTLDVQSGFVNVVNGVYNLHVRVRYPVNEETRVSLQEGMSLSYDVDLEIMRARRFWTSASVVTLSLQRELSYHSVSERYVVRDPLGVNEQKSFSTLEAALSDLGQIDAWPILVASQVVNPGDYTIRVRAIVRRGRLTDALRALMFWSDDWQRKSEWYSWSLPR